MSYRYTIAVCVVLASLSSFINSVRAEVFNKAETYFTAGLGQSHYEWRVDGFWRQDSAPNPGSASTRAFMWTLGLGIKTKWFPIELNYWDLGKYSNSLNFCEDQDYINTRCKILDSEWMVHAEGEGRVRSITLSVLPAIPYTPLYARLGFARIKGFYSVLHENGATYANSAWVYKNTLIYGLGLEKSGYRVEYFRFLDASLSDSAHDAVEGVMIQRVIGF
ncbi:MAG: hypothetical protein NUV80_06080 [Candidatus Berkelbacteria bacterium]|nr:hypothetical protein [Candidatus Berkelbacteria bacterium]